jgi:hypothetical protein
LAILNNLFDSWQNEGYTFFQRESAAGLAPV